MKIFDYSCARRGKQIGEAPRAAAMSGFLVRKDQKVYRVELTSQGNADEEWTWHGSASFNERDANGQITGEMIDIKPEDYGAEAICFCTGQWRTGDQAGKWVWTVIGTTEWNRRACQTGVLKSTFSHEVTE